VEGGEGEGKKEGESGEAKKKKEEEGEAEGEEFETGLKFGIFATRDLKEGEEVVLGWEWDDGSVVHELPAIIEDPGAFR
jgi:hypothetical protein